MTLKVKFADFEIITRSRSISSAVANRDGLAELATGLLRDNMPLVLTISRVGASARRRR